MSLSKQEFTDSGRSMLGRAQNGERLTISKIVVGSGSATQPSDLWPRTTLIAQEMNVVISTRRDYGQGTLLVEGSLRSDQAPHAFDLREVGVMAHIGTEADRLYSVANVFAEAPDHIDPANATIQVFKIKLIVDRIPTASLVVQIGPSENVTGENIGLDTTGPGPYKEALGNVLRFKRIRQGSRMEIYEEPGGDVIYIGAAVLHNDLDLYVPANYPGITDPNVLFPTIQAALDSVAALTIPPDKFVTVHVYSGQFTYAAPITLQHPNASQIKIVGLDVVALAVTGSVAVSGTLPNISLVLNVPSATLVHVNDVVYLHDAPHPLAEACGVVTAKRDTPTPQVTVRFTLLNVAPTTLNALATTKLLVFPTQIISTIGGTGATLFDLKTGLGLLKNFGLRAATVGTAEAVGFAGNGAVENVAVANFYIGIGSGNGEVKLFPVVAVNGCALGISAGPVGSFAVQAPTFWKRVSYSGCSTYGIWLVAGAYTGGSGTSTYVCCNETGIRSDTQGFFGNSNFPDTTGGIVVAANNNGLVAAILGVIHTALSALNSVANNVAADCVVGAGSQIHIVHNVNDTGKYNNGDGVVTPPGHNNRVLGPSGGYIDIGTP
jgi:hypothetical protein